MHEAQCHSENAFITLTYAPEHIPSDHSIHKEELQKFFKRLRKEIGVKIRYFACGEYGTQKNRPHYHAIIFGYDFPDKRVYTKTKNGDLLYRSDTLEKVWTKGYSLIGNVTFESAAYVARYVMKKRKGKNKDDDISEHYRILDEETGEQYQLEPEFCLMSRRPGIGREWLEKFKGDTEKDFITLRGKKMKLPKYYDSIKEQETVIKEMSRITGSNREYSPKMESVKNKRREAAELNKEDNTLERLQVKREVKEAQLSNLKRNLEEV
jgi:hypothetical protein